MNISLTFNNLTIEQARRLSRFAKRLTDLAPQATVKPAAPPLFDVVMTNAGPNKIQVIRAIRGISARSLKEAKALTEVLSSVIALWVDADVAMQHRKILEEVGATVEVREAR